MEYQKFLDWEGLVRLTEKIKDYINDSNCIINTTYDNLKSLRDNSKLVPGKQYRIIDYSFTTVLENTRSAEHLFDIIVTANSNNTLSEYAEASLHVGDTYFAESNLSAWKLLYSLDNDTSKYPWVDEVNGKGVIYQLEDEYGNKFPYDFKNMQFYYVDSTDPSYTVNADGYYYTFDFYGNDASTKYDRINGNICLTDPSKIYNGATYNIIFRQAYYVNDNIVHDTCSVVLDCYGGQENTYVERNNFYRGTRNIKFTEEGLYTISSNMYRGWKNNSFDMNWDIKLGMGCCNNTFGNRCNGVEFHAFCSDNTIDKTSTTYIKDPSTGYEKPNWLSSNIIFYAWCTNNHIKSDSRNISFGLYTTASNGYCNNNIIEESCSSITFGWACDNNTINSNCATISLLGDCCNNTIGEYSERIYIGNRCCNNNLSGKYLMDVTITDDCNDNVVLLDWSYSIELGNFCNNNYFDGYNDIDSIYFIILNSNCNNNKFIGNVGDMLLGDYCNDNSFNDGSSLNTLGDNCNNNTFNDSGDNTLGNECNNNLLERSSENILNDMCSNNSFGVSCYRNNLGKGCSNNIFNGWCYDNTLGGYCSNNIFNNYCEDNTFGSNCSNNTFGLTFCNNNFGKYCSYNTFGDSCKNNIFKETVRYNTFGNNCTYNTLNNNCEYNTFENDCVSNTFGNSCTHNKFASLFRSNTLGMEVRNNTFKRAGQENTFDNYFTNNTFEGSCVSNTFGSNCSYNNFSSDCISSTFGIYCSNNTIGSFANSNLGEYCKYNSIKQCSLTNLGNNCQYNTIGIVGDGVNMGEYCTYNIIEDNCSLIKLPTNSSQNTIKYNVSRIEFTAAPKYYTVHSGVGGDTSTDLKIDPITDNNYKIEVANNSDGEVRMFCLADLIAGENMSTGASFIGDELHLTAGEFVNNELHLAAGEFVNNELQLS